MDGAAARGWINWAGNRISTNGFSQGHTLSMALLRKLAVLMCIVLLERDLSPIMAVRPHFFPCLVCFDSNAVGSCWFQISAADAWL
jgi:hypothetical protein